MSSKRKYEFVIVDGVKRAKALIAIPKHGVSVGDLSGGLYDEAELSQDGKCWVGYDAKLQGSATVIDNAFVGDRADVTGTAVISGDAIVSGDAKVFGSALVSDNARVCDRAVVSDTARVLGLAVVSGQATVGGSAFIHQHAEVTDNAVVIGKATIQGSSRVFGHTHISGNAYVEGFASISDFASIGDSALIAGHAVISGGVHVYGSAHVDGSANISGNVSVRHHATVTGSATISGNVLIEDRAQVVGGMLSGTVTVSGDGVVLDGAVASQSERIIGIAQTNLAEDVTANLLAQTLQRPISGVVQLYKCVTKVGKNKYGSIYYPTFIYTRGKPRRAEAANPDPSLIAVKGLHACSLGSSALTPASIAAYGTLGREICIVVVNINVKDIIAIQHGIVRCSKLTVTEELNLSGTPNPTT